MCWRREHGCVVENGFPFSRLSRDKVQAMGKDDVMPLISIITVCFNAEQTIERTFQGVRGQSYPNIEYIIVDGGSTDATLLHIASNKDIISCLISEKDRGIYDAMNKGIKVAHGDIIGIINADDYFLDGVLDRVVDLWRADKSVDVICGKCSTIGAGGDILRIDNSSVDFKGKTVNVLHPSTFVVKGCYERFGLYDDRYRYAADHEFFCRLASRNAKFGYIDVVTSCFRTGGFGGRVGLIKELENLIIVYKYWGLTEVILVFPRVFVLSYFRRKLGNFLRKIGVMRYH